jgi:hypothetical protein
MFGLDSYATPFVFASSSATMHDCLRGFSRKVIAGFAQAFANVVGKSAILRVTLLGISSLPSHHILYDGSWTPPT